MLSNRTPIPKYALGTVGHHTPTLTILVVAASPRYRIKRLHCTVRYLTPQMCLALMTVLVAARHVQYLLRAIVQDRAACVCISAWVGVASAPD